MKKKLLRNLIPLRLFLIQFLIIGLLSNSVLHQACFCGKTCLHGLQGKANARPSIPFHARCSGTQCKSCNLEEAQTLKASNAAKSTEKIKTLNALYLSNYSGYPVKINSIKSFSSHLFEYTNVQHTPTYLKILSLLL